MSNYLITVNRNHYLSLDKETLSNPVTTKWANGLYLQKISTIELSKLSMWQMITLDAAHKRSQENGGFMYRIAGVAKAGAVQIPQNLTVAQKQAFLFSAMFAKLFSSGLLPPAPGPDKPNLGIGEIK